MSKPATAAAEPLHDIGTPLAAALAYAREGKPVFPCDPRPSRKHPDRPRKSPLSTNGHKDATTNENQIRAWWRQWPNALIGMPTGAVSGIAVLDTDVEVDPTTGELLKDGEAALQAELRSRGWTLPDTLTARTARGGYHRWFKHEAGFRGSTNILPNVDTRADRGYVILPGSRGDVGDAWEFLNDLAASIEPAPAWLAHVFRTGKPPKGAQTDSSDAASASTDLDDIDTTNADDIRKALAGYWDADDYDDWTKVALALHRHPQGRELWEEWAETSALYDPEEAEKKWGQTQPAKRITAGTILHRVPKEILSAWATARSAPTRMPVNIHATPFAWREAFDIPPRQWLYGRHLIRQFVSATVAPGGTGKSALAIADALAMATGQSLIGLAPAKPLRVWYWCGEDPLEETYRRVAATCLHYGIKAGDIGDRLLLDSGRDMPIVIASQTRGGFEVHKEVVEAIAREALERGIDVLIIDPFVSSHRVTENDNNAMDAVVKAWAQIADRANCAVELLHHARKTGGAEVTAEAGRGGSAIVDATRSTRALNRMTATEAARAGIENHRLYFYVDAANGKANLAPPADGRAWYRLVGVDLMNGEALEAGDNVGVVEAWRWPEIALEVPFDTIRAIQAAVAGKGYRRDVQSSAWVGHAIAEVMDLPIQAQEGEAPEEVEALTNERKRNREKVKGVLAYLIKIGALKVVSRLDEKGRSRPSVEAGDMHRGSEKGATSTFSTSSPPQGGEPRET